MSTAEKESQFCPLKLNERAKECLTAGDLAEARRLFAQALSLVPHEDTDLRLRLTNNLAIVERKDKRLYEAVRLQTEAGHLAVNSRDDFLLGQHLQGVGITNEMVYEREGGEEYSDRALIAYEAACHHYELAGRKKEQANTLNCIAFLFVQLNKIEEALDYSARAISAAEAIEDLALRAEFVHTRSQALLKAGGVTGALATATEAASTLRAHGRWLALRDVLDTIEQITAVMRQEALEKRFEAAGSTQESATAQPRSLESYGE